MGRMSMQVETLPQPTLWIANEAAMADHRVARWDVSQLPPRVMEILDVLNSLFDTLLEDASPVDGST